MSLTGAMINRYNDDVDTEATALRDGVGVDKAWANSVPETTAMPYLVYKHITTVTENETKGQDKRVMDATVQVDVWDTDNASIETILDLLEAAYIGQAITITGRSHLSTHLNNRMAEQEKPNLYRGLIEFRVLYEKQA